MSTLCAYGLIYQCDRTNLIGQTCVKRSDHTLQDGAPERERLHRIALLLPMASLTLALELIYKVNL